MNVWRMYVKRLFSRPWAVILTAAVPALILLMSAMVSEGGAVRIVFIDQDSSVLSQMIREAVAPASSFEELENHEEQAVMDTLVQGRAEYALVVPKGTEQAVLSGYKPEVRSYSLQGTDLSRPVRAAAEATLSAALNASEHAAGDREAFHRLLSDISDGAVTMEYEVFRNDAGALSPWQVEMFTQLLGMVSIAMLYLCIGASLLYLKDLEQKTYYRSLASPMSVRRFSAEANTAFLLLPLLQTAAAAVSLKAAVPQITSTALMGTAAVLGVFSLTAVSLCLAAASMAKTVHRTAVVSNFIIVPMAMLGGVLWPVEIMPPMLQRIAQFLPLRWVTGGVSSALSGASLLQLAPNIVILLLFAVVFQLLGTWKRVGVTG